MFFGNQQVLLKSGNKHLFYGLRVFKRRFWVQGAKQNRKDMRLLENSSNESVTAPPEEAHCMSQRIRNPTRQCILGKVDREEASQTSNWKYRKNRQIGCPWLAMNKWLKAPGVMLVQERAAQARSGNKVQIKQNSYSNAQSCVVYLP
jgi:hypothetical protein